MREWIKGGRTLPPTPLAGIDLNSGFMPVRRVFYFAGQPDIKKLQDSLAIALGQWPDFSATVVLQDGMLSLDRNDTGVPFTVEKMDQSVPPYGVDYPLGLPCAFCDEGTGQKIDDGGSVFTVRISAYNDNHWILGTCNSHALCDGSGYWQFMQNWRDAFHGVPLQAIDSDFMRHVKPLADGQPVTVPQNLKVPMTPLVQQQMENLAVYKTAQVFFPAASIEKLKDKVNTALAPDWVSSQDVLMALVWQTLARVSSARYADHDQDFPMANVINIRSRIGLKNYVGNMVYSVVSRATLCSIVNTPLEKIAAELRKDSRELVDTSLVEYLHFMQSQMETGQYTAGGYFRNFSSRIAEDCVRGGGIMINNWSKFPAYAMDFSGKPLWFDLATVIPMHFAMMMPALDGIVIRLFLPEEDLRAAITLLKGFYEVVIRDHSL